MTSLPLYKLTHCFPDTSGGNSSAFSSRLLRDGVDAPAFLFEPATLLSVLDPPALRGVDEEMGVDVPDLDPFKLLRLAALLVLDRILKNPFFFSTSGLPPGVMLRFCISSIAEVVAAEVDCAGDVGALVFAGLLLLPPF